MRPLQNILDIDHFSNFISEGKSDYSSLPWWQDCIDQVKLQVLTDKTTTHDNLRQKARDYASNYIAIQTEFPYIQKDQFLDALAETVLNSVLFPNNIVLVLVGATVYVRCKQRFLPGLIYEPAERGVAAYQIDGILHS